MYAVEYNKICLKYEVEEAMLQLRLDQRKN